MLPNLRQSFCDTITGIMLLHVHRLREDICNHAVPHGEGKVVFNNKLQSGAAYLPPRTSGKPSLADPTTTTLELGLFASSMVASIPFHFKSFSSMPLLTMF